MGGARVSHKRQHPDGQGQLDLGPAALSPEEVDARIEGLAAELSSLKRVRAARIGGLASGQAPRARRYTDDEIMKVFGEELDAQMYGARLRTAQKLGVSGKTVDVMALVIFFVPEPAKGVAEMKRVVKPGGAISAYAWDVLESGGFPLAAMQEELRDMAITTMLPPRAEVSRISALHDLWVDGGLTDVQTREITVARTFEDFDDLWVSVQIGLGMAQATRELSPEVVTRLKAGVRARLPADATGRINFTSRANAVTGRVPD